MLTVHLKDYCTKLKCQIFCKLTSENRKYMYMNNMILENSNMVLSLFLRNLQEMSPWSNGNNLRYQRSACRRAPLMMSHVNIYSFYVCCKIVLWKTLQQCRISWLDHVRIEIILLFSTLNYHWLLLIIAWCCRAAANINSFRLCCRELIFRSLPSNIMC